MKIAIDVSPLETGHKVRGVGFYLEYLKRSLLEYFPEHNYLFFTNDNELSNDIDVVHYPYFDPFFLTLPIRLKNKTVVTVHDLTPLVFPKHFPSGVKGSLRWQRQKFLLRKASAISADSAASKRDIKRIVGIPDEKVFVVHLAAGKEFKKKNKSDLKVADLRKKYNLPERFALYVGDVTWNKNVPQLIRAAIQSGIPLVMVGKTLAEKTYDKTNLWNKDLTVAQELIQENKNILTLGFVPTDDLVDLYNIATVFVFPSKYEGFGLPVIEAMQSGCPVITTNAGSLAEVAGDAAIFVNPESTEEIANAIKQVTNDTSLQKKLSEKGLKQAEKFSWQQTAKSTVAVYKSIFK